MEDAPASVSICGTTPAGAACAVALARANINARVEPSASSLAGPALVSRAVLSDLGVFESVARFPVEAILDRRLTEDEAVDSQCNPGDSCIVRRPDVISVLLALAGSDAFPRAGARAVRVDAKEFQLGDAQLVNDGLPLGETIQCISVVWSGQSAVPGRVIRLKGDTLAEVDGRAWIISAPAETSLILAVPLASIVDTSIAVPDVLTRLLDHAAVRADLPESEPAAASVRLLPATPRPAIEPGRRFGIAIGARAGLADPVLLDPELKSGMIAGEQVAAASVEGRISLARLSRIPREWSRHGVMAKLSR